MNCFIFYIAEQIFYDVETPFVKGKLVAIIRKLEKEFLISFDVKPHSFVTEWSNLIHFTVGSNIGNPGDRVPGVWFHESGDGRLFIVSPINGDPDHSFVTNPLALNQWTNVEISHLKEGDSYLYTVKLNGETVILQENAVAKSFKNVKVYTSDPWHSAPDSLIKNFHIINGPLRKFLCLYDIFIFLYKIIIFALKPKISLEIKQVESIICQIFFVCR